MKGERDPYPPPPVYVSVDSGEELARALHAASLELAAHFGMRTGPIAWDAIPTRQREALVATAELALRRMAMQDAARRGGAKGTKTAKNGARP